MSKKIKVIGPSEAAHSIDVYYELLDSANKVCDIIGEFLIWLNKNCSNDEKEEIFSKFAKKFKLLDINESSDLSDCNNVTMVGRVTGRKNQRVRVYPEDFDYDGYELPLDTLLYWKPLVDEIKAIKKDKQKKDKQYVKTDFNKIVGKLAKYYLHNVSTKIDAKDMVLWAFEAGIDEWENYGLTIKDARIESVGDRRILSIFYTDKLDRSHHYIAEV